MGYNIEHIKFLVCLNTVLPPSFKCKESNSPSITLQYPEPKNITLSFQSKTKSYSVIMAPLRSILSVAALAAVATASPVERRAVIGHDEVKPMAGITPGGITGDVYKAYQPYLYVANGCVPFPAVDGYGNTR